MTESQSTFAKKRLAMVLAGGIAGVLVDRGRKLDLSIPTLTDLTPLPELVAGSRSLPGEPER